MTDIVIPLKDQPSRWQDNELRYALRSIEKYLTGHGNIYIIGKKRTWLNNVTFIECKDEGAKADRIFNKILKAAKDERVSDPFLYMNDDHYLLKPLDIKEIKYWKYGTMRDVANKAQGNYLKRVLRCDRFFRLKGWQTTNFDIHVPILFEKEKFKSLEQDDYIIKSHYCNKFGIEGEDMEDILFHSPKKKQEIYDRIEGRLFMSVNDSGLNETMKGFLNELYPQQSNYESN